MTGALIVTAELGPEDFSRLDALRRRHFPPERNQLPAHLTMFHALPPSAEQEVRQLLGSIAARQAAPQAMLAGLMDLGRGVAFRVASNELDRVREEIALAMRGLLTAQDAAGWVPHVTVQNKVAPAEAKALKRRLEGDFQPVALKITGLGLHRYLGGPWQRLMLYPFRGR